MALAAREQQDRKSLRAPALLSATAGLHPGVVRSSTGPLSPAEIGGNQPLVQANPYIKVQKESLGTPRQPVAPGLGHVIPVLAAHAGAGASTCALALADAADTAGLRVLLIDTADPARSGLSYSCDVEGSVLVGSSSRRGVQLSRRRSIDVRRVAAGLSGLCLPDAVPDVSAWREALAVAYDVTVVDLAGDAWQMWAGTPTPAAAWLIGASTTPVVVLRATRRGLTQLEGVLAAAAATATAPVKALVSVGAATWPAEVLAVASTQACRLLDSGFNMPWDGDLERYGLTTAPSPPALQAAALHVLAGVGVPVDLGKSDDQQRHRRLPWPRGLQSNSERQR